MYMHLVVIMIVAAGEIMPVQEHRIVLDHLGLHPAVQHAVIPVSFQGRICVHLNPPSELTL